MVGAVQGARPAIADVDIVEVKGTVCVCLRPFASDCGSESD